MEETETPRSVRFAALLTAAMSLSGLLMIVAGALDLRWWGTPAATELTALLEQIKVDRGAQPPDLLRDGAGAVELIVVGVVSVACAGLALLIARGRRWARTWALTLGLATFVVALVQVGADASQPVDLKAYLDALRNAGAAEFVPRVEALVYPAGLNWLEDIAQGLQVLISLAVVVALTATAVAHPHHFGSKRTSGAAPDEWSAAISRIREQTVRSRRDETP